MSDDSYKFWQERFAGDEYRFGTEPNAFLKSQAHLLRQGERALAIADGEGRNGVFMAGCGLDVLSLDFSPLAQEKARKLAAARGVALQVEQADLTAWAWPPEAYDVVAGIFFQFATPDERARIFDGIKRTLKPGGLLLIQGYRPKQLDYRTGGPSQVENLYTRDMLDEAFGGFTSLHIREHDSEIWEGAGHGGLSALIDLVGRK
jgi:cyclopropane fatty-acyl-phospholipid synthase-like methyltransferase